MSHYECNECGMGVKGLTCSKCGSPLKAGTVKDKNGNSVQVSECPKQCGKIKSPTCCGHDMKVVND